MSYFLLEQVEARVGKTNVRLDDYYGAGVESFFAEYRGYYVTWDWRRVRSHERNDTRATGPH